MTYRVTIRTPLDESSILRMIEADVAEWRESVIPPDIRRRGVVRVVGTVRAHRFSLRTTPTRRGFVTVEVAGLICRDLGGRSIVDAKVRRHIGIWEYVLPILVVAVAAVAHGLAAAAIFVALVAVGASISSLVVTRAHPEAAYLEQRLTALLSPQSELNSPNTSVGDTPSQSGPVAALASPPSGDEVEPQHLDQPLNERRN